MNHDVTANLPIELVREIVSCTYKFQHLLKFHLMLQDIEDGTMCVLQTLTFIDFNFGFSALYTYYRYLWQWESKIHPEYNDFDGYEGASRYVVPFDVIRDSEKLRKQRKWCKYQTINENAALREYNHIISGTEYNMDEIKLDISLSGKVQCFDEYFHCK